MFSLVFVAAVFCLLVPNLGAYHIVPVVQKVQVYLFAMKQLYQRVFTPEAKNNET
jgi:hypothetical protein